MDFETYMNELNEEKKYKSKPTLGNIIKRDDNEKAIEIPYTISAMLKGLGFKGNRFFYVYKLNKFLIEVYKEDKLKVVLKAYSGYEVVELYEEEVEIEGLKELIIDKIKKAKDIEKMIEEW